MKNRIILCILLLMFSLSLVSLKYLTPARNISKIFSIEAKEVNEIRLMNGSSGKKINIANKNMINKIFNMLNAPKYNHSEKNKYIGFTLEVKIFTKGKLKCDLFFPSDRYLTVNGKRYSKASGKLDIKKILNYIK